MADFKIAIANVFSPDNEGQTYTNDPNDAGGETKFGVSKAAFPDVDIANLTYDSASKIWLDNFWTPNRLGEINNQELANKLLNMVGNSNPRVVVKQFQTAISICGTFVTADGLIGTATIQAANACNSMYLLSVFKLQRIGYYVDLVNKNSSQLTYLKGWVARTLR
jgi:lysozyme family protein